MHDDSDLYLGKTVATYLERHMAYRPKLTRSFFALAHVLLSKEVLEEWLDYIVLMQEQSERSRFEQQLRESLEYEWEFGAILAGFVRGRPELTKEMAVFLRDLFKLTNHDLAETQDSNIQKNLDHLRHMLGLTQLERDLCLYLFIVSVWAVADDFFNEALSCNAFVGRKNLAVILGSTVSDVTEALSGNLLKNGIFDPDYRDCFRMESTFARLLQAPSEERLQTEFFRQIEADPIPLDAHAIDPQVTKRILALLDSKPAQPVHILLYGPAGTGKTSYAHGLGKQLGLPMYQIDYGGKEQVWRRQAALTACINISAKGEDSLIIADDAESMLETNISFLSPMKPLDRNWLHSTMEAPGVRMIWTVNSVSGIEPSIARRFTMALHFKPFTRHQRERLWESVLEKHGLSEKLCEAEKKEARRKLRSCKSRCH